MHKHQFTMWLLAAAVMTSVVDARAQVPTGTVSGRVNSSDGLPLPGVAISVASPSLQGPRSTVTSETGDYVLPLLPPGAYTVTFELDNFQTIRRLENVASTQTAVLNVRMSPAEVSESVDVVAQARPFVDSAQVATSFKQELMSTLASNRTIDAVLLMAPGVHPTGPRGGYSMNGGQSYENAFLLNGIVINENLRGAPMTPYIEDAIQEVTVTTAGVSAEYGRFSGGVATAVTKSGGNLFSGSLRTSFANDKWRSLTPFQTSQLLTTPGLQRSSLKADKVVPTYEATFGGPFKRDRLWFFAAMRSQEQVENRTTAGTNIAYERINDEQRYETKLTVTPASGHTLQGSFFRLDQTLVNFTGQSAVADLKSLTPQGQPQRLYAFQYTGVLSPKFLLNAQYAARKFKLTDVGADKTDRINGTLVLDLQRGWRYWSPTFCSGQACGDGDEQRNNENFTIKGSYFASNRGAGSHHAVFGYDYFNDNIIANTHPSGSGYRVRGTSSVVVGTEIFPIFMPNTTTLDFNPMAGITEDGANLRMHSFFANDSWRVNDRLSLNLGLRLDKNDATDGDGKNVGDDLSYSPRFSAIWDPQGRGQWSVSGSVARYTMALTSNLAGSTAVRGNAQTKRWLYTGPAINAGATSTTPVASLTTTEAALQQVFAWHDSQGGDTRAPALASVPGVNMTIAEPLSSPYSIEYAGGVSRALGQRGALRADVVYRKYNDFYSLRTDLETGRVSDGVGNTFDLSLIENTNLTERTYIGLTTQGSYEFGRGVSLGGNYTLSQAQGSLDGETVGGGPSGAQVASYPEFKVASWNYPVGDLAIDQRHRARVWATYQLPMPESFGRFTLGLLQQAASGVPYAAIGVVNPTAFLTVPGYQTPPAQLEYFLLGRNPFRTEANYRTDLSVNYGHRIGRHADFQPELFFHGELLNVFNTFQLCGCGESVFRNGGIADLSTIAQGTEGVRIIAPQFNPYTTQPVQGTNYELLPNFGQAKNSFAWTSPRIFRFSVGVKF